MSGGTDTGSILVDTTNSSESNDKADYIAAGERAAQNVRGDEGLDHNISINREGVEITHHKKTSAAETSAEKDQEKYMSNPHGKFQEEVMDRIPGNAAIAGHEQVKGFAATHGPLIKKNSQAIIDALKSNKSEPDKQKIVSDKGAENKETIFEHKLSIPDVEEMYNTTVKTGLRTEDDVNKARLLFGKNELTPPAVTPWYCKLFMHMVGGFALLLWVGAFLCFIVFFIDGSQDNLWLGVVLSSVVVLTGLFSFYQEMKSDAAMDSFKDMAPDKCRVRRSYGDFKAKATEENYLEGVDSTTLVRGDVIKIQSDDRIAADCMLFTQSDMKVDHAALTGEPLPQVRDVKSDEELPNEAKNLVFYGTFCLQGNGEGIVIRTGDATMVGQIAKAATDFKKPKTTMEIEIEHFIHIVSGVAAVIGITFFIIALVSGYDFLQALIFMIGIIVANVPEGLLATVTVALTLTAYKMQEKKVLVKDATTIETLGSITCIASDKTGTLTQNRMTATHAIYGNKIIGLDMALQDKELFKAGPGNMDRNWEHLRRCSTLCGTAVFTEEETEVDEDGNETIIRHYDAAKKEWDKVVLARKAKGDASETAILKFNEPIMEDWHTTATGRKFVTGDASQFTREYRNKHELKGNIPFNSANKWMCTLHKADPDADPVFDKGEGPDSPASNDDAKADSLLCMVKGAPERIYAMANWVLIDPLLQKEDQKAKTRHAKGEGTEEKDMWLVEWDAAERARVAEMQESLAANGERVLGFGYSQLNDGEKKLQEAGCVKNDNDGTWDIAMRSMTAMPGDEFPNGGFMWAKAGDKYAGKAPSKDGNEDVVAPWEAAHDHVGMVFLGMMSLVDPPRLEVPDAIKNCHTAGINVVMVTGDHPRTAKAISERIGIIKPGNTIEDWVEKQLKDNNIKALEEYMWDCEWDFEKDEPKAGTGFRIQLPHHDPETTKKWSDVTLQDVVDVKKWLEDHPMKDLLECPEQEGKWDEQTAAKVQVFERYLLPAGFDPAVDGATKAFGVEEGQQRINLCGVGDHDVRVQRWVAPDKADDSAEAAALAKRGSKTQKWVTWRRNTSYKDPVSDWWRGFKFHDKDGRPHPGDPVKALVVAGPQITEFTEADWRYALSREQLTFARTLPAQKQEIVDHMQKHHESMAEIGITGLKANVVAVTGDGVNDSPALKAADCGVAMGTGSKVAQDAGNMVLTNDNFSSIVDGVKEGRLIFDNLKKSIAYTLTSNIPEITPFLALILFKIPIPLETVMILCIDLGTDMLPAISLAYEEPESDIMLRMPRDKHIDHLVNSRLIGLTYGMIGMIQASAGFCCYFSVFSGYGLYYSDISGTGFNYIDEDEKFICGLDYDTRMNILRQAQTSFLMSIIVAQWTDVLICKTRTLSILEQGMSNNVLIAGLFEELILGMVLAYVPIANTMFKTTAIDFVMWTYGVPFALLILVFDEVRKGLMRLERNRAEKAFKNGLTTEIKVGFIETCTYY